MAFSNLVNRVQYTGDGVTLVFAYSFKIFLSSDLKVYVDNASAVAVLQTLGVDYTLSGVGTDAGGNITFTTAPASGRRVTAKRELPLTQLTSWPSNDKFPSAAHEAAADRLAMIVQQFDETMDRMPRLPVNSSLSEITFPEGTSASNRALKSFRWDSAGTALELVSLVAVGTYIDPVTAEGDMIRGGTTGAQEKFAIGVVGSLLWVSSNKPNWFAPGSNTNYLSVAAGIPAWRTVAQVLSDIGGAAAVHTHAASDIASGTVATARLGSGSPSTTTFLRGDQTWSAVELGPVVVGTSRLSRVSGTSLKLGVGRVPLKVGSVWTTRYIPSAGITIANTSLVASTTYFVYVYDNAGTSTLELSTTGHTTDDTFGVEVKTGDALRTLVGMIRTEGSTPGQFTDSDTQVYTISYFDRKAKAGRSFFSADRTTVSTSFTEINTEIRVEFITWADEAVAYAITGGQSNNTAANRTYTSVGIDSTTVAEDVSSISETGSFHSPINVALTKLATEGYHYSTLLGMVPANTGQWEGGATTGQRTSLQVVVRG